MHILLYFALGFVLGFCFLLLLVHSNFPQLVRYIIASQILTVSSSSRNEQFLDLLFFHVLSPAVVTDELIDHVQRKLKEKDATLTTKCFSSITPCLIWDLEFCEGKIPARLADLELELNNMPKEYQVDYDKFVKTFYGQLEIKRQGGEFATKESFKKLGSLKSIWRSEELRIRWRNEKEKIREGAPNVADEMEKGISDSCEKTLSDTVTT